VKTGVISVVEYLVGNEPEAHVQIIKQEMQIRANRILHEKYGHTHQRLFPIHTQPAGGLYRWQLSINEQVDDKSGAKT
jgi:hypothetical protein